MPPLSSSREGVSRRLEHPESTVAKLNMLPGIAMLLDRCMNEGIVAKALVFF
jgi:hypothetical protein